MKTGLKELLLLFILYILAGYFGISIVSLPPGNLTLIWFPAGIGTLAFLLFGRKAFLWIWAASWIVNSPYLFSLGSKFGLSALISATLVSATIDAAQTWFASYLWRKLEQLTKRPLFSLSSDIILFLFIVCFLPPLFTTWGLVVNHLIFGLSSTNGDILFNTASKIWLLLVADGMGIFLIAPFYLLISKDLKSPPIKNLKILPLMPIVIFIPFFASWVIKSYLVFLVFPVTLLIVIRLGVTGAVLSTLCSTIIAIGGTIQGKGAFVSAVQADSFTGLLLFILAIGSTLLYVALTQEELQFSRDTLEIRVEERTAELEKTNLELEAANKAKGIFLANMSHEIRTPLNGIIGLTNLVLSMELNPTIRDYLSKVYTSSKMLLTIINDILDFSKIESGKIKLESIPFYPAEVIQNVKSLFFISAKEKNLELIFDISDKIPSVLIGDPVRFGQILNNLVGNAVKFTEIGQVIVTVNVNQFESDKCRLTITIKDTGIGINTGHMDKLFQPFSQADESITRKYGGTGLGLSICKRLVDLMNGTIQMQSEPGIGTIFTLTLDFLTDSNNTLVPERFHAEENNTADESAKKSNKVHKEFTGLHVLVVEDNEVNQKVARGFLERMGITCEIAGNGAIALEILKNQSFDAVFMDIQMPVLDGIETVRRIRLNPAFEKLPVIAMTAAILNEDKAHYLEIGMNDIVEKPINNQELKRVLNTWVKK